LQRRLFLVKNQSQNPTIRKGNDFNGLIINHLQNGKNRNIAPACYPLAIPFRPASWTKKNTITPECNGLFTDGNEI
jgi:hypothetical protein